MLCRVHLTIYGDHQKAIEFGKKAVELNPNDPRILWAYGTALALSGAGKESLENLLKSYSLSPKIGVEGSIDNIISSIIVGYYISDDCKNVIDWFDELEKKDFRSYVLCISSMITVGMEIHFLESFQTQYSQIDYRSEIELFQFKDSKITTLLIDLVSGYLPGRF
tara:strand:- start:4609 stop:5103 length:495 start_codon:yes stop_codon:yes gene_type:complete